MKEDTNPLISIITPVYNGMPYLEECINSVKSQTISEWELLISDDGSKDSSIEYLNSLNDTRIKIFRQKNNLGIFGNLNFLIEKASSPICQILCQDDFFSTEKALESILKYWENAESNIGFVRFNHKSMAPRQLTLYQMKILPRVIYEEDADLYFFLFGNIPGNLSNVSLKKDIVKTCNGFSVTLPYAGDFDFWSRSNRVFAMGIQDEVLTYVRRHPNVASNTLNFKGELISQKAEIVQHLFDNVVAKYGSKFLFKLHATLNYDILQRDNAVRLLLKGNSVYYKELSRISKNLYYIYSPFIRWALYILTLGGRKGRVLVAKMILKNAKIIN